jgi:hypothetical protein
MEGCFLFAVTACAEDETQGLELAGYLAALSLSLLE